MRQYIIQPNDTLFFIAKQFGVPLVQLIRANPEISDQNSIYIVQITVIPNLLPVPNQLDTIKLNAEDIINDIYGVNWSKANSRVNIIKTNMTELIPLLQKASVPNEIITNINQAIKNLEEHVMLKKTYPAIADATNVIMYIPDILDYFEVIIPTDVNRLEYLVRQIIIDVESNNWDEANKNYLTSKKIWESLKPKLNTEYSKDIAEFDLVINNLGESISNKNYQSIIQNANKMINQINLLEEDFKQQNLVQ